MFTIHYSILFLLKHQTRNFIDDYLTGPKHVELLEFDISERVAAVHIGTELWWMHDRCPAHNYGIAREFLHAAFLGHVIGSNEEPIAWLARSPEVNPCHFFCGAISSPKSTTLKTLFPTCRPCKLLLKIVAPTLRTPNLQKYNGTLLIVRGISYAQREIYVSIASSQLGKCSLISFYILCF